MVKPFEEQHKAGEQVHRPPRGRSSETRLPHPRSVPPLSEGGRLWWDCALPLSLARVSSSSSVSSSSPSPPVPLPPLGFTVLAAVHPPAGVFVFLGGVLILCEGMRTMGAANPYPSRGAPCCAELEGFGRCCCVCVLLLVLWSAIP